VFTLLERETSLPPDAFERVYAPIGLDIGAETPAENRYRHCGRNGQPVSRGPGRAALGGPAAQCAPAASSRQELKGASPQELLCQT